MGEYVAWIKEKKNLYRVLVGKLKQRPHGRTRQCRYDLKEIG
jgi:hypothetical protein